MSISNRDRVGRAFELLAAGLEPYVAGELRAAVGEKWWELARTRLDNGRGLKLLPTDPQVQLRMLAEFWQPVFGRVLGRAERNLVFELQDVRNRWAHNERFTADDAYRALDSIERLLIAISAPEATHVTHAKQEVLRLRYEQEARKATPAETPATASVTGLHPWREVITPHHDVATGRFQQAEFAADLAQVHRGEGSPEYRDPVEFFRRTYLTQGLRDLLLQAAQRVTGHAGVPVVNLQTNFGGGKTHSLLALYHLLSGIDPAALPQEVQDLLRPADIEALPAVQRAVLVGTALRPGQPSTKPDGTTVRTLWGELAWQLGGADGYALVAKADETGTNPGDALVELFRRHTPCLILIDECVAYARQLYSRDDLPAGTFDVHFTFAQALTEASRAVPGVLTVISIPASEPRREAAAEGDGTTDVEVGGVGGREALRRLRNAVGRMESSWRPASAEESFEIVRRRLFEPIDPHNLPHRDATARVFADYYRAQNAEFPVDCRESAYAERIKAAYPIHPELFARLYGDWSTLDRFQRTRGVLRLMAAVVHALWQRNDQAPLILPASLPLDDTAVLAEVTRHLEDNWKPIIDADVDGPASLPVTLDRELPNLGRYSAARRVARTVFLGSAPTLRSAHRGIEASRIRLGCALPGESVATFGDALKRLTDRATYLYVDGARHWYGVQPSVARLARDRAERLRLESLDSVHAEIVRWLRAERERGAFAGVHVAPRTSAEVPDEPEARLVVLHPETPYVARSDTSPALTAATEMLERRGTAARNHRNTLVFLAADQRRLEELERGAAEFLAWRSIDDERTQLNLDGHQLAQVTTKRGDAERAVRLRIAETYSWALVPTQPDPTGPVEWEAVKVEGQLPLAARTSRRLLAEAHIYQVFAPALLRMQLDGLLAPLWPEGWVAVRELWQTFARYLYLPRLLGFDVLADCVRKGPASLTWTVDGFATADGRDAASGRFLGLAAGAHPAGVQPDTLVVSPALAQAQLDVPVEPVPVDRQWPTVRGRDGEEKPTGGPGPRLPDRFYGAAELDPARLIRDFGRVSQEVIQHLAELVGAEVTVTVEVKAKHPDGFTDRVVRTVSENAHTLGFSAHEFE